MEESIKAAAEAEERHAAEMMKRANEQQEEPVAVHPQDESLVSIMAQGRDHLLQRMREHAAEAEAKKQGYKPPPMTERQLSALEEEQAAGRRAIERHAALQASRPVPPRDPSEGTSTPVHRPGNAVPSPFDGTNGGFVAGSGQYAHDAAKVIVPGQ